jgi:large subunit ribosomal protein L4
VIWKAPYSAPAVSLAVRSYLTNSRQATSKTKSKDEVSGGGKKPWRQKGTGRARQGSIRSPQFRGGGIVFGPSGKENYHCQVNKKVKKKALQSVLQKKAENKELIIIEQINLPTHKTKEANNFLAQLKLNKKKVLIILSALESKNNQNVKWAFQNLPLAKTANSKLTNTYELLNGSHLIFTQQAFAEIEERLKKKPKTA